MSEPVIRVDRIGKQYRLGTRRARAATLRDAIAGVVAAPMRNLRHLRGLGSAAGEGDGDAIWALREAKRRARGS